MLLFSGCPNETGGVDFYAGELGHYYLDDDLFLFDYPEEQRKKEIIPAVTNLPRSQLDLESQPSK